jgi:small subunit ribosomal protein S8
MRHDLISDVLSAIQNGDKVGKKETVSPASELVKSVLQVLQKNGFVGNFELVDDGRGGKFRISLTGKINRCGAVRPRFSVSKDEWEMWERRFLPAAGFGLLIVSTSNGVMTHEEAKKHGVGGKLLGFVY